MEFKSYPKVNIGLYVSKKRNDGYHNIISIFQRVNCVYDVLDVSVKVSDTSEVCVTGLEKFVEEKQSSVYKAAMLWLERKAENYNICVKVEKNVPVQSGLGSPSSNAATVLKALEYLTGNKLKECEILEIAEEVGSDTAFFIYDCDAAVVSSKGEIVRPIEARKDIDIKLIFPENRKTSTKEAYEKLDSRKEERVMPSENDLLDMYYKPVKDWSFGNDFEIVNEKPEIKLEDNQKLMLTGSGSCWFTVS